MGLVILNYRIDEILETTILNSGNSCNKRHLPIKLVCNHVHIGMKVECQILVGYLLNYIQLS